MIKTNRRSFLKLSAMASVAMASAVVTGTAHAAQIMELTAENWETALASGKPIAVRFFEHWCPNCTAQGKQLASLLASDPKYDDFIVLEGLFGQNRDFAAQFGIRRRTSIAIIKDGEFITHNIGGVSERAIRNLLDQAL